MRRLLIGLIASAVTLGIVGTASAHTGDLKVTAVCNTNTGNYDLVAKLTTSNVPKGNTGSSKWRIGNEVFQGTPTSATGMDKGPVSSVGNTTVTLGSWSLPGTTTGYGPWVYSYTKWLPDGYAKGSDGRLTVKLKGDCRPPQPLDEYEAREVSESPNCVANTVKSWKEERLRSYTWDQSSGTWVPGPWSNWVAVPGSELTRQATVEECPPPVEPPVTPPVEPPVVPPTTPPVAPPPVPEKPAFTVSKTVVGKKVVRVGGTVTFRVRVANTGKVPVMVRVTDVVPHGMVAVKGQAIIKGAFRFNFGTVPNGSVSFLVRMKVVRTGKICNVAKGTAPGLVARSARACVTVKPAPKKVVHVPVTG